MTPETTGLDDYFPERTLAAWLTGHDLPSTVYAFSEGRRAAPAGRLPPPRRCREAALYRDAVAAATRGDFGDVQFTRRTHGSTLFVNPLMANYFTVGLDALAARSLYLDQLENTYGMRQVATRIERFREATDTRPPRAFPH